MFDYHMHTIVSNDGHDTPTEMAQAALKAGLKEICFTDHLDYMLSLPREQTSYTPAAYRCAYDGLQIPGLTIRHGAEVGLAPWNKDDICRDLRAYPYDFVLGSVHFIDDEDIYFPEFWIGRDFLATERLYFQEILHCVQLHDDFDVLGHLTYISKCKGHPRPRIIPLEDHKEVIAEILKVLIAKGKGMEINTSGVDRCGDYLPGVPYLNFFKELGGEIVTVGSDAHSADRVGQYTCDAIAIAREIFGHVCTFQGRQPIFHKL